MTFFFLAQLFCTPLRDVEVMRDFFFLAQLFFSSHDFSVHTPQLFWSLLRDLFLFFILKKRCCAITVITTNIFIFGTNLHSMYIRKSAKYNPDFYGIIVPFGTFST